MDDPHHHNAAKFGVTDTGSVTWAKLDDTSLERRRFKKEKKKKKKKKETKVGGGGGGGGNIQGGGLKFLDRFKSYFGSQISSQSLNEVHMYPLQPKSATKGDFFFIYFCL